MPFPAIPSRVVCPRCNQAFVVQVRSIVDVGEEPALKEQFLSGEVNHAQCPQCGSGGLLSTPLIYHDPDKELLISFVPPEMNLPADEQERLVGSLVNAVMNATPTERRKGYFLKPQTTLTLDGLYDAVLEADGITQEMLEAQRATIRLIEELLDAMEDQETFAKLVDDKRASLNYAFFLTLSEFIEAQDRNGAGESASELSALREKLLERVTPTMPAPLSADASLDDLIAVLLKTEAGVAWSETIALNYGRFDYGFFQALTARIEEAERQGDAPRAEELGQLRQRILEEIDRQRNRLHEAEDEANLLILELLEADDLAAAARARRDEFDEVFFAVLNRLHARAAARNDTRRVEQFEAVSRTVQEMLEEQLPPEVRLIGRLIRADYPDGSDAVLNAHRGLLNNEFLRLYDTYVEQIAKDRGEPLATKLKDIRGQIVAKMTILRL
jgi:hypothetical protein